MAIRGRVFCEVFLRHDFRILLITTIFSGGGLPIPLLGGGAQACEVAGVGFGAVIIV